MYTIGTTTRAAFILYLVEGNEYCFQFYKRDEIYTKKHTHDLLIPNYCFCPKGQ